MKREKAKEWVLAGLAVVVAALAADDVVLHQKIGQTRQEIERRLGPLEEEAAVSAAERAEQARGWWEKCKDGWKEKWAAWRK